MEVTAEKILAELGAIAFAKATDMLQIQGGQLVIADTTALTTEQACAIASVEKATGGIKVKFYDKLKALELLGKATGLFDGGGVVHTDNGLLEAILEATAQPADGPLTVCDWQEDDPGSTDPVL